MARLELSIGKLRQTFARTGDTRMPFHVVVPRRQFVIADRPVDRDPLLGIGLKVEVAPTVALSSPGQRATAHLIASIPVEPLDLRVRRFLFVYPKSEIFLIERVVPLEHGVGLLHGIRATAAVQVFPRSLGGVDVVLDVLDVAASLQQQHTQPFLRQLLGRPSAGNARADHDCVKTSRLHVRFLRNLPRDAQ